MTDTERDPTRTEDVEEALEAFQEAKSGLNELNAMLKMALRRWDAEEFGHHENRRRAYDTARRGLNRLRRRADRLEEAVREAKDILECFHTRTVEGGACDRCKALRRLRSALDSREDEGDVKPDAWHQAKNPCTCPSE